MASTVPGPGSASARASAEAAAGASEIIGAAVELPSPTPDAAPEPDGSSPPEAPVETAPAATPDTPDADTPAPGDDYDPEEAEAALAARDAAAEMSPEVRKVLEQYKDPAALAKALYETKKYSADLAAKLKAGVGTQPAAPAAAPPAAPPAAPSAPVEVTPASIEAKVGDLIKTDPRVSAFVNTELAHHNAAYGAAVTAHDTLVDKINAHSAAITKREGLVDFLTEQFKANPEDFRVRDQLVEQKSALLALRVELQDMRSEKADHYAAAQAADAAYRAARAKVYDHARGILVDAHSSAGASAAATAAQQRTAAEWQGAFPRVMGALNIPEAKRKQAERFLLHAAYANPGDIDNIEAWMMAKGKEIAEFIGDIRADAVRAYSKDKKADATQPAPRGPAALAKDAGKPPTEPRLSSKEASKLAGEGFSRSLGVAGARR